MNGQSQGIRTAPTIGTRQTVALGLLSAAIIAYQLVLMQLISIMQWYHFAYMVISVAMLGFGAAGTTLAIFRHKLLSSSSWLIPVLMSLSGLFMILSFQLVKLKNLQFDIYTLFFDKSQFWILAANYIVFFIPFYLGAIAIGIILTKNAKEIDRYYFANLLGSGAGGIITVLVLSNFFAIDALPVAASLAIISAILGYNTAKRKLLQIITTVVAGLMLLIIGLNPGEVPLSQYKALSKTLLLPDAEIRYSKPDIYGRVDVVSSPALRYAPAISLGYTGNAPVLENVFANGHFYGVVPLFDTTRADIHNFTTDNLPYVMGERKRVLIPDASTGTSIAHAFQNGADEVVAATSIKTVKELMQDELAASSSYLFSHPGLKIHYQDGRQLLFDIDTNLLFDAVILPRLESFGGSTGLNALSENYLLTLEALEQIWEKLSEDGVISVTSWMDYPPRTTLKIANTLLQMLASKQIKNPRDHIAAIRSWGTITFVICKTPIEDAVIQNIRSFGEQMMFDMVLLPEITPEDRNRYNFLEDQSFFEYLDTLFLADNSSFFKDYDFYVAPATDDKPYFHRLIKPHRLDKLIEDFESGQFPLLELGYLIVWVTLFQGGIIAVIFILLPLLRLKITSKGKTSTIIYFAALGLGYMFVEIILIQRFVLYFGHPIYAISAVISTMMIASGVGSLFSGRFSAGKASVVASLIVLLFLVIYVFALTPVLMSTIHYPVALKILIAFVLLALPSFFMGMPFPSGIRVLDAQKKDQIPWAWGINGSLSVVATALATLFAVEMGFRVVIIIAILLYLIAGSVAFFTFAKKNSALLSG